LNLKFVRQAPGIHLVAGAGTAAGLVTAFSHLTPAQAAALWSAVTVASSVAAGLLRKPPHVALASAAVSSVIGDLAAFHVHVSPGSRGAAMALLAFLTGSVVRLSGQAPAAAPSPASRTPARDVPPVFPASR
jgi:hypothetical protein